MHKYSYLVQHIAMTASLPTTGARP